MARVGLPPIYFKRQISPQQARPRWKGKLILSRIILNAKDLAEILSSWSIVGNSLSVTHKLHVMLKKFDFKVAFNTN